MPRLTKAALESELAGLESLLRASSDDDPLGNWSLESRVADIRAQLESLTAEKHHAEVTLLFYGRPVSGSRGIDAEFAGKALQSYQSAISKRMNSLTGRALGRRGPIPERSLSRMNIVDVVHGSFGFRLEEDNDALQMFDTSLKDAVDSVSKILTGISSPSEKDFEQAIDEIDGRTFISIKSLIEIIRNEEARFKILTDDIEQEFDDLRIERAYQRVERTIIDEEEQVISGILVGILPVARRFEFHQDSADRIINGPIDVHLSTDFLERIENDEQFIGKPSLAVVRVRTVRRPDGREKTEYTLTGLREP